MLLRNSSAPILRSLCFHHNPSQPGPGATISFSIDNPATKLSGEFLDSDEKVLRRKHSLESVEELREEFAAPFDQLLPGYGRGGGGGDRDDYGGKNGGGGGERFWDSRNWNEKMDLHYRKMIEEYPGDALLLGNYARFLKEVLGDDARAEEYCERAILADPGDGNILSLYGDLIWDRHKDGARAQSYFDQALHNAPNNCYVHASYAKFLWDMEEEEEKEEEDIKVNASNLCTAPPTLSHGWPPIPPAFAAS